MKENENGFKAGINTMKPEIKELENKLKIAVQALEHYATKKLYFPRTLIRLAQERGERLAPIYSDFGEVAQEALKQIIHK